ncbi:RNA polymerase ECF-type sigma factor [Aquipluma nitroreducens]|uniref:RNA polymerase ECF-type sigma factor n=1 Tax=Aquipluma nitroreducens TaxID=2010828 RepID=A0A5K7S4A5_9BACT|nr:RNA polymerase ECF-type sigma factor [Aquipluma nitroreducens]
MKVGQEYIGALKLGSEKAFRKIMDCWYSGLFNFANGYLNNVENAKEVLQDVFLKLWDNRHNLDDNTNLNAYLYTITRNRCIDLIRRERLILQFRNDKKEEYLRLTDSFEALSDPILDNLFASEIQDEIHKAVAGLPEQCRKVFILSRTDGMKNREISESLHLSEKTVESHLTKALKTIKLALERRFPGSLNLMLILTRTFSVR